MKLNTPKAADRYEWESLTDSERIAERWDAARFRIAQIAKSSDTGNDWPPVTRLHAPGYVDHWANCPF